MKLVTHTTGTGARTAALVHGASMSSDVWRDFAKILVDEYDLSVVVVDQRGHGESPRADSYQVADFAADLVDTLPPGLDFLMGQSLGGVATAWALPSLLPGHYIGLDPAFAVNAVSALALRTLGGPLKTRLSDGALKVLGFPPKGAASDLLVRTRAMWNQWDTSMMQDLVTSGRGTPFPVSAPVVPSTLVLAEKSFVVSRQMAKELSALGWDVRVKLGAVHDLHTQDPAGVIHMIDDVLRSTVHS